MTIREIIQRLLEFDLDAEVKILKNNLPVDVSVCWCSNDDSDCSIEDSKRKADMVIIDAFSNHDN